MEKEAGGEGSRKGGKRAGRGVREQEGRKGIRKGRQGSRRGGKGVGGDAREQKG